MADAVQTAPVSDTRHALAEHSGTIAKVVFALLLALAVALAVLVVNHRTAEAGRLKNREAWDELYLAEKDLDPLYDPYMRSFNVKAAQAHVAALEGVWEKARESNAQPYLMMRLAALHYELAQAEERAIAERKASLEKAKRVYQAALDSEEKHLLYGALAADGVATCLEEEGDYAGAIQALEAAVGKFEKHYLYTNFCYRLARAYWLRARNNGQNLNDADRETAVRYLNIALRDDKGARGMNYPWRDDAEFLRTLLSKNGPAWQGPPPPERPKPAAKTEAKSGEAAPAEAKKSEAAPEAEKTAAPPAIPGKSPAQPAEEKKSEMKP